MIVFTIKDIVEVIAIVFVIVFAIIVTLKNNRGER